MAENDDDWGGELGKDEELGHSSYVVPDATTDANVKMHLGGMFKDWFIDYASYVILNRAVPYLEDGLKPVQRRILHTMKTLEDGRYNKVASIVGEAMKYHPHGDASIYGAVVSLGQKNLLIDTQGNWGNIFTGDGASAMRYIEARLSPFAKEVVFSPKVTEWKVSYDGRNKEPVALPIKFPLLLAHGIEGIAVGLQSYVLPHNFIELLDASIAYLKGEEFQLFPDFPTGGMVDVQRYADGAKDGYVRIRSHIVKRDNKTLVITDLPYSVTSKDLKESIVKANDKGKISIKDIVDLTSSDVEIVIRLSDKTSSDKTIDALYAFTQCEVKIWPNCCVVEDKKPVFTNVTTALKVSADRTREILKKELEIEKGELLEQLNFCSLEKIFIENRIYKDKDFEQAKDMEAAIAHVDKRLKPFVKMLVREVTREDILRLMEIKMKRILKFSSDDADNLIAQIQEKIKDINHKLDNLTQHTIDWFEYLKKKYGAGRERKTEIKTFDNVVASKVAEANEKLYIDRENGFFGYGMKKDEFVCNCSDIDDVLVVSKEGKFKIKKVKPKDFEYKNVLYLNVYKKNDKRMVYNVVYRDGKAGPVYIKRFNITGIVRDKEYDITMGTAGSRILYFSANQNAEAEVVHVVLKPKLRLKVATLDRDFADIAIKGRQSRGNVVTKNEVVKVTLKQKGASTMGGRKVWFDTDVQRLNYDGHGDFLGEFLSDDRILVVDNKGNYYLSTFEDSVHFPEGLVKVEKFEAEKVWTVCLYDANEKYKYVKRFVFEPTAKPVSFLGDNPKSELLLITDTMYPRLQLVFGGADAKREPIEIDAEEFIGVKGLKAKGKRLHTYEIAEINELEPTRFPEPVEETQEEETVESLEDEYNYNTEGEDPEIDPDSGQIKMF